MQYVWERSEKPAKSGEPFKMRPTCNHPTWNQRNLLEIDFPKKGGQPNTVILQSFAASGHDTSVRPIPAATSVVAVCLGESFRVFVFPAVCFCDLLCLFACLPENSRMFLASRIFCTCLIFS